jgi:ABC-type antimicrobial peptide transport system permease subunit
VTAFLVTRRTREIGIRLALGAQVREIMVMVLSQGVKLLIIGAVIGLVASFATGFALQRLLFEIKPVDVLTLVTVTLVVVVASIAASYMPARRATRVDPMVALRVD